MTTPAALGPYPIERELGRGGMGVVYLGRDPRLQRSVAIKVLSADFGQHPDHLARFEREARLLASLNHPNIAAIHGVEATADGKQLLVLEYVPGDTLAERLARGPLPVDEALDAARQIAAAVEVAHDGGVIHRDLKPGNVKITPDGQVKVLDFGLATSGTATDADRASSPTFTSVPTAAGVILGTAGYMSPEQARGRPVDRRTDVWAFGCVLFECLTGRRIFDGETISDTIANILQREPDWSALPAETPGRVRDLLRRCLEKDVRRRQRDMGDVRLEIEDILSARSSPSAATHSGAALVPPQRLRVLPGAAILIVVAVVGLAVGWLLPRAGPPVPAANGPVRMTVVPPAEVRVRDFGLAPDGSQLILRAVPAGGADRDARLYARRLGEYELRPIAGTEGVQRFAFSPDARWLAVLVRVGPATGDRRLMKIPVDGSSPPVLLAQWEPVWFDSFVWLADGDLLVNRLHGQDQAILRISTATGEVGPTRTIDFGSPGMLRAAGRALPGHGVFVQYDTFGERGYQTDVWVLDPATGGGRKILENAAEPVYLDSGHLIFTRGDTIMAAAFDPTQGAIRGEITALVSGLSTPAGPAGFELADNGTLAYVTHTGEVFDRHLVAIDAAGGVAPFVPDDGRFTLGVALDPAGTRAVATVLNPNATYEAWIAESSRSTLRRAIALSKADVSHAVWSPDGQSLAYYREGLDGRDGTYLQQLVGAGDARRVFAVSTGEFAVPTSWLPDGSAVLITKTVGLKRDLHLAPIDGEGARVLRATPANEENAVVSSDGRLVAFASDESGQTEIHVASFANGELGQPVPVSRGAAQNRVRWAPGTHRLYFCDAAGMLLSVEITLPLSPSAPQPAHDLEKLRVLTGSWDVTADGRIIGIRRSEREDALPSINVVLNWTNEVRRRLGVQ